MLGIKRDYAQSVLAAIRSLIVTECNVVQVEALLYRCEKFYDISRSTEKKNFSLR